MPRYRIHCPACGWRTAEFEDRFEADEAMREHAREIHPDWPVNLHFRRETVV